MLNARRNVQLLANRGVAVGNRHKAVGRVLDIVEVAGRGQAAELDLGLTGQQLGDNGRDNGASALARAVGVERAHDSDGQVKAAVEALGQAVRADFGGGVGALALERVLLVDGHVLRRAVDLAGGGDEHALGVQLTRGVQHIQRALDVGVHVAVRAVVGEGDRDERGQMEHALLPAHGGAHAVGVAHVAHEDVDFAADLRRQGVDPAQRAKGIVQTERADLFAALDEFFGQVAANKAVCAGDHNGVCHCLLLFKKGTMPHISTLLQNSITDFGEDFNCKL